jgi:tetratricopeptide (TPR) repeat protein
VPRDPTDLAAALHERAVACRAAARPAEARRLLLRALALFERHDGPRHPDVANVLLELAGVAQDEGAYAEGLARARRALAILRPLRGSVDLDRLRAQAYARLGSLHVARGEYGRAGPVCRRALAIARAKLSPDDLASALNDLAIVCKYTSRFAEAGRLYRQALAITVREHGPRALDVAAIFHNLGGLEHSRGRYGRAEPHARKSVAIRTRLLGKGHPTVAADIAALAAILHGLGMRPGDPKAASRHRREAERLYRRAIAVFSRALGKRHFEVGFNLGQLAALCQVTGRLGEASRLYRRAIAIQREVLGSRHPQLALTLTNFAELRRTQGRTKDARAAYARAIAIYGASLGKRHPDTVACIARRADLS